MGTNGKVRKHTITSRRRSPEEVKELVRTAISDPSILELGIVEIMDRYSISYPRAAHVKNTVMERHLKNGNQATLLRAMETKRFIRTRRRIIRTERKYPFIHRRLLTERYMSRVGEAYNITRERSRQIKDQIQELSKMIEEPLRKVLDDIEHAAGTQK